MKGIYKITIDNKSYIGKDTRISHDKRLKDHIRDLNKGTHYNSYLQQAYDKNNACYIYTILFLDDEITLEELASLEIDYIQEFNSYLQGYNMTSGGEGTIGYVKTEEERQRLSESYTGEKNPRAKLSNEDFFKMVELFKIGKTNKEIAEIYGLHDRYVSLIRHKKRFCKLWEEVTDYIPSISDGQQRGLDYEQFVTVMTMLNTHSNAEIAGCLQVDASCISNIRSKKTYKRFWDKYLIDY